MDFKNSEGYPDPTCYQALKNIYAKEQRALRAFRPIVYICSPYSGDVAKNVNAARRYCRFAVDQDISLSHRIYFFRSFSMTTTKQNAPSVCFSETP